MALAPEPAPAKTEDAAKGEVKTEEIKSEPQLDPTAADFDSKQLSDEQFAKIFDDKRLFNHERFKSLNERAKKADSYEQEKSEAERKKLEDEKKFEELNANLKKENETLKAQQEANKIDFEIKAALLKENAQDADIALLAVNRADIKINKDSGQVEGVAEAVETLKKAKAFLFGKGGTESLGSDGANGGTNNAGSTKRFKLSQIKDHNFFMANMKDIMAAQGAGNIEDDVNP